MRHVLAEAQRPIWTPDVVPAAAYENLHEAARRGLDAHLYWPGLGEVPVADLVLRCSAAAGPRGPGPLWGVNAADADRLLGFIEQRCITGQTGAAWQIGVVAAISERGADRAEALRQMTQRYIEHMHTNEAEGCTPVAGDRVTAGSTQRTRSGQTSAVSFVPYDRPVRSAFIGLGRIYDLNASAYAGKSRCRGRRAGGPG